MPEGFRTVRSIRVLFWISNYLRKLYGPVNTTLYAGTEDSATRSFRIAQVTMQHEFQFLSGFNAGFNDDHRVVLSSLSALDLALQYNMSPQANIVVVLNCDLFE